MIRTEQKQYKRIYKVKEEIQEDKLFSHKKNISINLIHFTVN